MAFKKVDFEVTIGGELDTEFVGQGADDVTLAHNAPRPAEIRGVALDTDTDISAVTSVTFYELDSDGYVVRQVLHLSGAALSSVPPGTVVPVRTSARSDRGDALTSDGAGVTLRSKFVRCLVLGRCEDVVGVTLFYETAGDYRF